MDFVIAGVIFGAIIGLILAGAIEPLSGWVGLFGGAAIGGFLGIFGSKR